MYFRIYFIDYGTIIRIFYFNYLRLLFIAECQRRWNMKSRQLIHIEQILRIKITNYNEKIVGEKQFSNQLNSILIIQKDKNFIRGMLSIFDIIPLEFISKIIYHRMNLLNKVQGQYEQLWKYIIRPSRKAYPDKALGPDTFLLENKKVKRIDFQLINPRGFVFYCSHFVPLQQQSYPCLIYLHGNSSNRTEGMELLGELIRRNISLCTFDFSGCGNSQGQYVTLGYYEWQDLHQVVQWIRHKQKVTKVGLWGRSMGAVTTLLYLKKSQHIQVAVVDSPFKSLKALVQDLVKKNSKIPMFIVAGALKFIASTIQQKANFSIYDLNPLKNQVGFLKQPAFFMVGKQDQLIPCKHTEELYNAYSGETKQLRIVDGGHNDDRPYKTVHEAIDFIEKYLHKTEKKKKKKTSPLKKKLLQENILDNFLSEPITQNDFLSQPTQKKTEDFDFFGDNNILQAKQQNQDQFKDYQKMVDEQHINEDLKKIDFFAQSQNTSAQEGKDQKKQNKSGGYFSFSGIINVLSKATTFQSPKKQQYKQEINDSFKSIRQKIIKNYKTEDSDLIEQNRTQRMQALAKIKQDEIDYDAYLEENSEKIYTWIFA